MNLPYRLNSGKNSKLRYYISCYLMLITPHRICRRRKKRLLASVSKLPIEEQQYIKDRVSYYCKLNREHTCSLPSNAKELRGHTKESCRSTPSVYFFDTLKYTRSFEEHLKWDYMFGDVVTIPATPSILKSRPINDYNYNSVIMKLNKVRHFIYMNDRTPFEKKANIAIFRGCVHDNEGRESFVQRFFKHPMFDIGVINDNNPRLPKECVKESISLNEHLKYKFIMTLEGNDVASNLKWVMSSGSIAVMPKPTCETWFMEGRLKANYHYIEVASDFSDLEERLEYYIAHPDEAKQIVRNANQYIKQFKNRQREDIISLMVLQRYFEQTGQL